MFGNNTNAGTPTLTALSVIPLDGTAGYYLDNLCLTSLGPVVGTPYCASTSNSTSASGWTRAFGDPSAPHAIRLIASQHPPLQPTCFLASMQQADGLPVGGSQGLLCVGPSGIGRFDPPHGHPLRISSLSGATQLQLDPLNAPTPTAPLVVFRGTALHFQAWYRDDNPGPTSDLTGAVSVMLP